MDNEDIVIAMDNAQAMKTLCQINDGDCALMYAYASACGGRCRPADFAIHTGFDDRRVERCRSLLILYKVCRPAGATPIEVTGYTPAELLAARKADPSFSGLCDYFEQTLKHPIRKSEIETLYGIYDKLNLPADVIMLMINYCRSRGRLSARELEKTAYSWHDKGIATYALAAEAADRADSRGREYARVLAIFGIKDRAPSESEEKYISAWLDMGVSDELIGMAYDRTVMRTGKLQWRYMHRILDDWHKKGLASRKQVEQAEGAVSSSRPQRQTPRPQESVVETVSRMFEQKRAARERLQEDRLEQLRRRSPEFVQNESDLKRLTVRRARLSLKGSQAQSDALTAEHKALLQKRQDILGSLGLAESYITIGPDCPICMDRGYIGAEMCECFKRACAEEEQRRKKENI